MKQIIKQIITEFIKNPLPEIKERVSLAADTNKIIYIMGAAKVGKTFILLNTIKRLREQLHADRMVYIDFNDYRLFPASLQTLDDLIESYYELYPGNKNRKVYFFFDDIWRIKNWESFISNLHDNEDCAVFIAGPASDSMYREIQSFFGDQILVALFYPLGFDSYYRFKNTTPDYSAKFIIIKKKNLFYEYLAVSSFPGLLNQQEHLNRKALYEYLDSVIYQDLAERYKISNMNLMKYLFKYLLSNPGSLISVNKITNEMKSSGMNISRNSVYEYIKHLEDSCNIFIIKLFTDNLKEEHRNPVLYYPIDAGLTMAMTNTYDKAKMLEIICCIHLKNRYRHLKYYVSNQDINFVVKGKEGIELIGIHYDISYSRSKGKKLLLLRKAMEKLNLKEASLITTDSEDLYHTDAGTIKIMPAWKWLLKS